VKFFRYGPAGQERCGTLDAQGVRRDISDVLHDLAGENLSQDRLRSLESLDLSRCPEVSSAARLGPCISGIGNFIAVGLNYADHAEESGLSIPAEPILFNKAPSCVVGPNDEIMIPPMAQKVDWEVELAVVIGAEASHITEDEADNFIAGYCICNDVSEREYQLERGGGQWAKGKGCPTFGPLGPYLVTPDEVCDVQDLAMWLDVNGQPMQRGSTATMIFSVKHLVAHISRFMILRPGDVITTGTPPGVGLGMSPPRYLKPGDKVRLGIEGLGEQFQSVVSYSEKTLG
jgi:2,4-didehydro-3-deoxy-L-rhamnonate hydrolase